MLVDSVTMNQDPAVVATRLDIEKSAASEISSFQRAGWNQDATTRTARLALRKTPVGEVAPDR